jgi:hypothetical protein
MAFESFIAKNEFGFVTVFDVLRMTLQEKIINGEPLVTCNQTT